MNSHGQGEVMVSSNYQSLEGNLIKRQVKKSHLKSKFLDGKQQRASFPKLRDTTRVTCSLHLSLPVDFCILH